jgi:hypothetical protein
LLSEVCVSVDDSDALLNLFTYVIYTEAGMSVSVMANFLGLGLLVLFVPQLTYAFGRGNSTDGQSNLLALFA